MTEDAQPPRRTLKQVRILLWILVALAVAGTAALVLTPKAQIDNPNTAGGPGQPRRPVHSGRRGRQAVLERGARGQALRHLFRLHPLRRRLPDHARALGQAARTGRRR